MRLNAIIFLQLLSPFRHLVNGVVYKPSVWVKQYQVNYVPVDEYGHTFEEIVEYSNILADKTLLIKALVESERKVFLITLPENWGKSINLMMLKTFFGVPVYADGANKYRETSWSYQYFKKGFIPINFRDEPTNLISPPLIAEHEKIIEDYLGKYPVVYLNFTIVDQWTERKFDGFFRAIKQAIGKSFAQHSYLMEELREHINNTDANFWCTQRPILNVIQQLDKYIWEEENDEEKILRSVQYLSNLLHKRFAKPVVVLIDNYDHPFNQMYVRYDFPPQQLKIIKKFYFKFLENTLKTNVDLFKGIIAGEINMAGSTNESDLLAYAKEHTLLDNELYPFYGLTKPEVDDLRVHAKIASKHSPKAHKRYSGYKVGNVSVAFYNMWSVARFLNKRRVRNYWKKTEGNYDFFLRTFELKEIRDVFKSLLTGDSATVRCQYLRFNHEHVAPIKRLLDRNASSVIDRNHVDLILRYFLAYGYVTLTATPTPPTVALKLPNAELEREIAKVLHRYYATRVGFDLTYMANNESLELIKFVRNTENATIGLEKLFATLFRHSRALPDPPTVPVDYRGDSIANTSLEDSAYCLLYLLALQTKIKKNVDIVSDVADKSDLARDIVLCYENKALVIRLTYRTDTTQHSLEQRYRQFFKTKKTIKSANFVIIVVSADANVNLRRGALNIH